MRERRISRDDVRLALDDGEGTLDDDGTWYVDLGTVRVVVVERDDTAHVVTVIPLRTHT